MTVDEIVSKARAAGVTVREVPRDPGHFRLTKRGMVDVEVFSIRPGEDAVVVFEPGGRYPAQLFTEGWADIIFP